jgi:hypothetical protein
MCLVGVVCSVFENFFVVAGASDDEGPRRSLARPLDPPAIWLTMVAQLPRRACTARGRPS